METWKQAARRGVPAGVLAGAVTSAAAALGGRHKTGSAVAALNAPSHIVHREDPARVERATLRHTVPGLLINTAATIFWATLFEKAFGEMMNQRGASRAWTAAAWTATAAYVTDYYIVPRKLRPGYERRATGGALLGVYAGLALSLGLAALLQRRR